MPADPRLITLYPLTTRLHATTRPTPLPIWPAKDPADFLIHKLDFGPLMASGVTIEIADAAAVDGAATLAKIGNSQTIVAIEIGGGVDGTTVTIVANVRLSTGELIVRSAHLPIIAQPGATLLPAPPSDGFRLTDPKTGQTFTDAAGLPLTIPSVPSGSLLTLVDPVTGATLPHPDTNLPLTVTLT